jgi:thiosulfate/3-mercaptopyruvate sulfurtransferase
LVDVAWLAAHLQNVCVVDATWQPLVSQKDPRAHYEAAHIPGACFFDHRAVSEPSSDFTDTRPRASHFAEHVGSLGIGSGDTVVVYSQKGTAGGASRAWWMFRSFGHERVAVLDGGLVGWQNAGHPVATDPPEIETTSYLAESRDPLVAELPWLRQNVEAAAVQIVDARPAKLFAGEGVFPGGQNPRAPKPEPGRIPGSVNVASSAVVDPETKTLRSSEELRQIFAGAGVDCARPTVTTCSLGVGAATLALALAAAGASEVAVFDGAWEVWGSQPDTPKERG